MKGKRATSNRSQGASRGDRVRGSAAHPSTTTSALPRTLLLLGSGELGKEFAISAKRLGCRVIAVDRYAGAPAMQVADAFEVIDMLDGAEIRRVVATHAPDFVVPEIEAIRTEALVDLERRGVAVVPSAMAAHLTMNRDAIREVAARELRLPTARYGYATSAEELESIILGSDGPGDGRMPGRARRAAGAVASARVPPGQTRRTARGHGPIGLPCVIKPVMSSSGKGQSVVRRASEIDAAWRYAIEGMRGDKAVVIAEEFIKFDYEITLLTVKQRRGRTLFVRPIGHRQERGDYQESWMPCPMPPRLVRAAERMAKRITDRIAGPQGAGLFGVEFFVAGDRVIFSELSPRPHDTGMVTLASQDLSEFDLHLRAILGLPIPLDSGPGASADGAKLSRRSLRGRRAGSATESSATPRYHGVEKALALPGVEVRLFGKPIARRFRRMGVVLARGRTAEAARRLATRAAGMIRVKGS